MKGIKILSAVIISLFLTFQLPAAVRSQSKKTQNAEEVLKRGREAFYNYDFEEAAELYEQYRSLKKKAKQPIDEEIEIWEKELEIAANAFERVQKIVIVDSISVPLDLFYNSYKLGESSGSIGPANSLVEASDVTSEEIGFINEAGNYVIFPKEDREGELRLYEKINLLDGSWDENETLMGDFDKNGDYAYPFMSSDGQTLYFANNGEGSMGGYDLFVAQKDAISGEYRQPLNLGMPFNSPYDDIMLAIDEENGLGWWATNRNDFEGKVTIYVFLYEDVRKNYSSDLENLAEYAKISSYKSTWIDEEGEKKIPRLQDIEKKVAEVKEREFSFDLGDGKTYYRYYDFKNRKAADLMKQYLSKLRDLEDKENKLQQLRGQFKRDKSLKDKIIEEESRLEKLRDEVNILRKGILKEEKSGKK